MALGPIMLMLRVMLLKRNSLNLYKKKMKNSQILWQAQPCKHLILKWVTLSPPSLPPKLTNSEDEW
eukprot:12918585-Prorocentrum_lima.AAC.1